MEPHKIWIEQCEAARGIQDEFGEEKALNYPHHWGDAGIVQQDGPYPIAGAPYPNDIPQGGGQNLQALPANTDPERVCAQPAGWW